MSPRAHRCHNPNWDCFHIDGGQWAERKRLHDDWYVRPPNASDPLPWVSFGRFLDMEHYQNIQTRMLGSDRFPYSPTRVEALDVRRAFSRIDAHCAGGGVVVLCEHAAAGFAVLGVPVDPDLVRARSIRPSTEFTSTLKGTSVGRGVLEANVHDQTRKRWREVGSCARMMIAERRGARILLRPAGVVLKFCSLAHTMTEPGPRSRRMDTRSPPRHVSTRSCFLAWSSRRSGRVDRRPGGARARVGVFLHQRGVVVVVVRSQTAAASVDRLSPRSATRGRHEHPLRGTSNGFT